MSYLIITVLLNALISVLFKYFARYKVDELQAIVVNYWVCVLTGSIFIGYFPLGTGSITQSWSLPALIMGAGFIGVFSLFAWLTKTEGITTATVANKLSLAVPVIFSVLLYHEPLSVWHIAGILLAFPAVYLAASGTPVKPAGHHHLFWSALLFAGSGLLDTGMQYVQHQFLATDEAQAVFSVHLFAVAGCIGILVQGWRLFRGQSVWSWRSVCGGVLLGVPNFFSIYCFIRMLHSGFLQSTVAIPLNNICILLLSVLCAVVLFREPFPVRRIWGVLLSVLVILLLSLG